MIKKIKKKHDKMKFRIGDKVKDIYDNESGIIIEIYDEATYSVKMSDEILILTESQLTFDTVMLSFPVVKSS